MDGGEAAFEHINALKAADKEAEKMADQDLFTINVDKSGLSQKREKLAADRFKEKDRSLAKSATEQAILKKLRQKQAPHKKQEVAELEDLWATPV